MWFIRNVPNIRIDEFATKKGHIYKTMPILDAPQKTS